MLERLRWLRSKWTEAGSAVFQLDEILDQAPDPKASPRQKKEWFIEFLMWLFHQRLIGTDQRNIVNARLRYLFMVLDRNPEWRAKFIDSVSSILTETSSVELFVGLGLSTEFTFFGELWSRISRKVILRPPADHDFAHVFATVFTPDYHAKDAFPIQARLFEQFISLLEAKPAVLMEIKSKLSRDAEKALRILAVQFSAAAYSSALGRLRSRELQPDEPFVEFLHAVDDLVLLHTKDSYQKFIKAIGECEKQLNWLSGRLDEFGVSLDLVYQLEVQENRIDRMKHLAQFTTGAEISTQNTLDFLSTLIDDCSTSYGLRSLVSRAIHMMSRKIVETNADVGDHYIARTDAEFKDLFRRACGGGLITVLTVVVKTLIYGVGQALHNGFLAGLNYAASFLMIHFCGFTLGTKQPAMTGAALAGKIENKPTRENIQALEGEIRSILWSQIYSVLGNVATVIPGVLLVDWITMLIRPGSKHFMSVEKAHSVLESLSPFGPTPIYAALTGGILFLSSVAAGWANNWFILREQYLAIANNRRLRNFLGAVRAEKLADFLRRNIAGIAGNVALGFSLGLFPAFFSILGIPLDVRHVTLMSGSLGLALPAIGWSVFASLDFWLAVAGIAVIGVLNISVSFALALYVAIRSKGITPSARWRLYLRLPSLRLFFFRRN